MSLHHHTNEQTDEDLATYVVTTCLVARRSNGSLRFRAAADLDLLAHLKNGGEEFASPKLTLQGEIHPGMDTVKVIERLFLDQGYRVRFPEHLVIDEVASPELLDVDRGESG